MENVSETGYSATWFRKILGESNIKTGLEQKENRTWAPKDI